MAHTDPTSSNYETSDAQIRPVLIVTFFLMLLCAFGFIGASVVLGLFQTRTTDGYEQPSPLFVRDIPKDAILLVDEPAFADEYVTAQKKHLSSSGWVDRSRGVVHIPIKTAIALEAAEAQR